MHVPVLENIPRSEGTLSQRKHSNVFSVACLLLPGLLVFDYVQVLRYCSPRQRQVIRTSTDDRVGWFEAFVWLHFEAWLNEF
jgi:hypothetical protein